MKTFTLPLIITSYAEIQIEADNLDEAHDKLIDLGKKEVLAQSVKGDWNFEVDWDAFEPPEDDE
jgi:hypothetical protein